MRAFRSALVVALASSAIALFSSARQWVHLTYSETGFPNIELDLSGRDLDPLPAGLAVLVVATILALLISRGLLHRLLALVIALAGFAIAVASWRSGSQLEHLASLTDHLESSLGRTATGQTTHTSTMWWAVSLVSGLLAAFSGVAMVIAGHDRPRGSTNYERSSSDAVQLSPWQALDQGVDPTLTPDR
jgi:uncharacterized membrane protein (TIGR02234 family)